MKKFVFIMPLMAISLLASCGGGDEPKPEEAAKFRVTETTVVLDKSRTSTDIILDWTPTDHAVECSGFTFTLKKQEIASTITIEEVASRPLKLSIKFDNPLDEEDTGDLKFRFNDKTVKKSGVSEIKDINVKKEALENYTWAEISEISQSGEAAEIFEIGDTKTVKVNNQNHEVRIIGFNHDYSELPDDGSEPDLNKKLGITFEFVNVITASNGDAIASPWNQGEGSKNYDYRVSTLNTFLNNDVLNMLPSSGDPNNPDLRDVIKQVDKKVGVSTDSGTTYTATSFDGVTYPYPYLFPLAHDEITVEEETDVASDEGETYQYYKSYKHQRYRIKKIAGSDERDVYWLRSPYTGDADAHDDERATWVDKNGGFTFHYAYFTRALAPAFCI